MAKVLHVIPAIAPRYGGPSVAVLGMCRALNKAGCDTLVATTDADGPGRLDLPVNREASYEGVRTIVFRRRFSESYKWSGAMSAWLATHASKFDVVHVHAVFSHSSIAAGRACRKLDVPYIVRPLGTLDPWSIGRKRLRKRALFHLGADRLLFGAAGMHYTSLDEQRLAESVVSKLPAGTIVPNGIDDALFVPRGAVRNAKPYVLCLARLDEKKGIDLLIEAFHQLSADADLANWQLVIAGKGSASYERHLRRIAESGRGAFRVVFKGWVDGDAKVELLREAGAFVLGSHQENFGISVAEALAAAVPVVVTPGVNLASDISVARAGWVVERSVPALADLLQGVMSDAAERERRGRAGRMLAERFRWPAVAKSLMAMYEQVMLRCAA